MKLYNNKENRFLQIMSFVIEKSRPKYFDF